MQESTIGIFKPEVKTVKQVLGDSDSYYLIPDYQRPYSWKTEHIEDLWDDIFAAMNNRDETCFLGAMILIESGQGYYEVVDGQQRLTTLIILLCVIRDLYLRNSAEVNNSIRSLIDKKYRLRLITQSQNQTKFEKEVLKHVEFPERHLTEKEREKNLFLNAAILFRERLASLGGKKRILQFVDFLLNKVVVIRIISNNKTFAIKLFQVLNARGLELSSADLIKSHLYGICDKSKTQQLKQDWIKAESIAKDVEEDIEDLITYYVYYMLERNPKRDLFTEFVNSKYTSGKEAVELTYEIVKFAEIYKAIYNATSADLYSFWYLPNTVYWSTILISAKYAGYKDFDKLVILLRKVYYCYWIADYTIAKIKQLSFNLIAWVKRNKSIQYIENQVEKKMKTDKVIKYMNDNLDEDVYDERWLKPVLALIEYSRCDDSKIAYIDISRKELQVEHILPVKWHTNSKWKKLWDEQQAAGWLNRLGNLTLLSGLKNIVARNDSFEDKKRVYRKAKGGMTAFEITKEIVDNDVWVERNVKARHKRLKNEIFDILS